MTNYSSRVNKDLKKLIANLLIGMSISAIIPTDVFAITRADGAASLEVSLTGGWFQNDTANTSYGILRSDPTLPGGGFGIAPTGQILEINPKNKFAGGISVNYQTCDCYTLGASYFSYHNKHRDTVTGGTPAAPLISATLLSGLIFLSEPQVSKAESQYNFGYDFANMEFGSTLCFIDNCLTINPKIGLSYARISADQTTVYSGSTGFFGNATGKDTVEILSRYRGFGPSIGADVDYLIWNGFSILGNFRSSALVGNLQCDWINTASADTIGGLPANLYSGSLSATSKRQVVKLFQMELGLGYTFDWCGYYARIVAGYQLTKAIDSNKRIDVINQSGGQAGAIVLNDKIFNSSFQGPFMRLTANFGI